MTGH